MTRSELENSFLRYRQTRNPRDLATVYDTTSARLLAVAAHLCSTIAEAEDAVQDTFLVALEHPERWDESRPLVPWLLGILGNCVRSSRRRSDREPDIDRLTRTDGDRPDAALESEELLESVEAAVQNLAQPYRSVVLLRIRNGLSPADIAIALDRNPSTIRAQLTRGLQMLRKLLPAGFAAGLFASLTANRGLAMVREVVLDRACTIHRVAQLQRRAELVRTGLKATLATAAIAVGALFLSDWFGESTPVENVIESAPESAKITEFAPTVDITRTEVATTDTETSPDRIEAARLGAISIRALGETSPASGAAFWFEPVGSAGLLVHERFSNVAGPYRIAEPAESTTNQNRRTTTTDTDGWCHLTEVRPGPWLVRGPGCFGVVIVEPGETAAREFTLSEETCTVTGLVLDEWGAAVPDASIWIGQSRQLTVATHATRTDRNGRFTVTVRPPVTVGVRVAAHAPISVRIQRDAERHHDVEFRLAGPGATVRGVVVDTEGAPVPGAAVRIGHSLDAIMSSQSSVPSIASYPVQTITGADGAFRCEGIAPGPVRVSAWRSGSSRTDIVLEARTDETAETRIELAAAATVTGIATGVDGVPVANVHIRTANVNALDSTSTVTDENGRFRLQVSAGHVRLRARDEDSSARWSNAVGAGEVAEWNPQLTPESRVIAGVARYADGAPVADGFVSRRSTGLGSDVVPTASDGSFEFQVPEFDAQVSATLAVYDRDPRHIDHVARDIPLVAVSGIFCGMHDVQISVPPDRIPNGFLRGRIVDQNGAPPPERVSIHDLETGVRRRVQFSPLGDDGAFDTGPIPPGRYAIWVRTNPQRQFGPFEVPAGETTDLGNLRFDRSSSDELGPRVPCRAVFVPPADGSCFAALNIEVRDGDNRIVWSERRGGSPLSAWTTVMRLPSGPLRLTATSPSGLAGTLSFTVDPASPPTRPLWISMQPD